MNLTERECRILQLEIKGLSDYKIAQKMNSDSPSIRRSRLNAHKKLKQAQTALQFAQKIGLTIN
jgi:DNA-binding NarL/FixJ family response regulator